MNNNTNTVNKEKEGKNPDIVSEYKIGYTTYFIRTFFKHNAQESLSEILKRLIISESERMLDGTKQKQIYPY